MIRTSSQPTFRLLTYLMALAILLVPLSGCVDIEEDVERPGLAVLLFPDATSSITQSTFDQLKAHVDEILRSIPYDTHVEIIPVSERRPPPSRSTYVYPPRPTEPIERVCLQECQSRRGSLEDWIKSQDTVLTAVRERYQDTIDINRSCLLNAVARVENRARNLLKRESIDEVHVIILSDMIEECDDTPIGDVNLRTETVESETEKLSEWSQTRDWTMLRDSSVYFSVIRMSSTDRMRSLVPKPVDFWRPFFAQFGGEGTKWDLGREVSDVTTILSQYGAAGLSPCEDVCN